MCVCVCVCVCVWEREREREREWLYLFYTLDVHFFLLHCSWIIDFILHNSYVTVTPVVCVYMCLCLCACVSGCVDFALYRCLSFTPSLLCILFCIVGDLEIVQTKMFCICYLFPISISFPPESMCVFFYAYLACLNHTLIFFLCSHSKCHKSHQVSYQSNEAMIKKCKM